MELDQSLFQDLESALADCGLSDQGLQFCLPTGLESDQLGIGLGMEKLSTSFDHSLKNSALNCDQVSTGMTYCYLVVVFGGQNW